MTIAGSQAEVAQDRELVSAFLRARDEEAFRSLYRSHTPRLYRIAYRLLRGDPQTAEELIQNVWIRAVGRLPDFRWDSSLRTWLTGILINCVREAERERQPLRAVTQQPLEASMDPPAGPERIDLERAVAGLPDGYREILVLHDIEGYSHREIAGLLGINEGTSKSQLSQARHAVRRRLGWNRRAVDGEEAQQDDHRTE